MKIRELKLKNFAKFEDFEIIFNDGITNLIGINGSGKTTVGLTALWAGFKGIAEKSTTGHLIGERYRFISKGKKSLDVEITLDDEQTGQRLKLNRHITKSTNTIKITPLFTDKPTLSREDVENLFNVSFLSANHFSKLTGQEQAAAMGIDTSEYDEKLKIKKEEAQEYRRDIKKIGDLDPVEECEKVDIAELFKKKEEAAAFNRTQVDNRTAAETWLNRIKKLENQIDELQGRLAQARNELAEVPKPEEPIDLEPIQEEIDNVQAANQRAASYELYQTNLKEKIRLEGLLNENLGTQKGIASNRAEYLQSKTFGIKGLQIDEKGQLTKDDKLIREPYFSKGELEVLVARIAMNLNPELKVRFIDNFELLDDKNQERLIKNLTKKGFQIITAEVGDIAKGDNSVLLKSCAITEDLRQITFDKIEPGKEIQEGVNRAVKNEPETDEDDYF